MMKRLMLLVALVPTLLFGAANDLKIQQFNTGGTATVDRIFAPVNGTSFTTAAGFRTAIGAGTGNGSVTSVALSAPAIFTVGGSPVTSSGTLALTYSGTALPVANGGTGGNNGLSARQNLSASIKDPPATQAIFITPASSYVGPTTGNATLTFARSFDATQLLSTGLYSSAAHNTAAYTWDTATLTNRFHSSASAQITSLVAYPDLRDLTQAAWVKVNTTAAKNQVGIDGISSAASSLTSTLANATTLYAITLAATTRTFSAFVKRITGGGQISITRDGGTTWIDVTNQLSTGSWARVSIVSSVLNPVVGFRIAVSGDAIAVDSAIDTNTASAPNPLLARADERTSTLTYSSMLPATVQGRLYYVSANIIPIVDGGESGSRIDVGTVGTNSVSLYYTASAQAYANLNTFSASALQYNLSGLTQTSAVALGVPHKVGLIWGLGQIRLLLDDTLQNTSDLQKLDPAAMNSIALSGAGNFKDLDLRELHSNNVLLLGDSLTADVHYPALFRAAFSPIDFNFDARGLGGNTITDVTARVTADVTPYFSSRLNTNIVLLWIGTNTAATNVSSSTMLTQLATCISTIKAGAAWTVYVITTIPSRTAGLSGGQTPSGFTTTVNAYNAGLSAVAGVDGVIDIASLPEMQDATNTTYFTDGIHINTAGYNVIFPVISAALK